MKFIKKHLKIISIIIILILSIFLIILKIYLTNNAIEESQEKTLKEEIIKVEEKKEIEEQPQIEKIYVDIKGAVTYPGVYEIESDKKVIDVVNKAGGLTDESDTSMINLAKQVSSEMVIIIYTKEEVRKYMTNQDEIVKIIDKECVCPEITNDACVNTTNSSGTNQTTKSSTEDSNLASSTNEKINLNTATIEELQTLTGIGESKAKSIIEYREEHGTFSNIEEIKEISGIGDSLYEKIKDNITV